MAVSWYEKGPVNQLIIKVIKPPLRIAFAMIADKLPEPTIENTVHPNSHQFIKLRDEFLEHDTHPHYHKLYRGVANFVIVLYDYDAFWAERIDWVIEKIKELPLVPRQEGKPAKWWWKENLEEGEPLP